MNRQSISLIFLFFIEKNQDKRDLDKTFPQNVVTLHGIKINVFMVKKKSYVICAAIALLLLGICGFIYLMPVSTLTETVAVNIDNDDTPDSVWVKIDSAAHPRQLVGLKSIATLAGYTKQVHTGHYEITKGINSLFLIRKLKNGRQDPLLLTIPEVRTKEQLAEKLGNRLMMSADSLLYYLNDSATCAQYQTDTANIIGLFIPNSYEVYWNITPKQLISRMEREWNVFWDDKRMQKAHKIGLTPPEVITLASIVDEETANNAEKPTIAGMYLNRLNSGMPLQADPTIKFALRRFELRRIYHEMLKTPSKYNTYINQGLPPGPIRIPSVKGIESVLNAQKHDYMYMCAKEDFSGFHNFAKTFAEHIDNAKRYSMALNKRGVQ